MRARSSDGHKNVLSLIGYSHLLENRWEGTQGVCGNQKTKQAKHSNQTQTKREQSPTPSKKQPYHGHMSVARSVSDFWSFLSDPRAKESGVHGWHQCKSLLSSSEALQLVTILVACILFLLYIICPQAKNVIPSVVFTVRSQSAIAEVQEISTRSQPFHDTVQLPTPW